MSSFLLGGKRAEELGLVMLRQSQRPVLPGTTDRTLQIAGRHGAWDFGADLNPRLFNLVCAAITRNPIQLQQTISALAAHLVDEYGRPRNLELIFSLQPERKYIVRYSGTLPIERVVGLGQFTLPLIAFDPFAYAEATALDVPAEYDTGKTYDQELLYENTESFNWRYFYHMSSLQNYGTLNAKFRIEIVGKVINPKITNVTTGKWISFDLTNNTDDVLVFDGRYMWAYQAKAGSEPTNVLGSMSGDFFDLTPGQNKLVFEGIDPDATVFYKWMNTFI